LFNKNCNSESLIDFIEKNLPLLTVVGFSIVIAKVKGASKLHEKGTREFGVT